MKRVIQELEINKQVAWSKLPSGRWTDEQAYSTKQEFPTKDGSIVEHIWNTRPHFEKYTKWSGLPLVG